MQDQITLMILCLSLVITDQHAVDGELFHPFIQIGDIEAIGQHKD